MIQHSDTILKVQDALEDLVWLVTAIASKDYSGIVQYSLQSFIKLI